MLDQKDLELLKDMMESIILKSEKRVDAKIAESENMLLDEMYRIQASTEKRLDKMDRRLDRVESRLESMQHDINANKLEAGTIDILSMRMDRLEDRIASLEDRSA